ncbi:MAG: cyclic nucleotide-binding domain-containing protein [Myxococcales bacterium]|nr:cyclic nucleotide-binding domain-containing protein [Myxococcales bacterium]
MQTVLELRAHADQKLFAAEYPAALHAYALLVRLQPNDLEARLRVADTLLAMGEVQAAALVYTALARHAANAGHPLVALVALKILEALDPEAGLLASFAKLYGKESPRLGRGVRLSLASMGLELPADLDVTQTPPLEQLLPAAAKIAVSMDTIAAYPEKLPPIPIFSELPADAFARVLAALKLVRTRPGDAVLKQGDVGTSFFVIVRGTVRVVRADETGADHELARLHDGSIFGEMALVSAQPRTASVYAAQDCDLLEFDRDALAAASAEVTTLAAALDKFTRERLIQNVLATSPLFRPLEREQRVDLLRRFSAHDVAAGTHVIREGEPGRGLFLLLAGEVDVWKRDGDEKVMLATLKPGDVFGEISLLNDEPTTATVTAGVASTVLFLDRALFRRLVDAIDAIRDYVENLGDERLLDQRLTLDAANLEELDEDDLVMI